MTFYVYTYNFVFCNFRQWRILTITRLKLFVEIKFNYLLIWVFASSFSTVSTIFFSVYSAKKAEVRWLAVLELEIIINHPVYLSDHWYLQSYVSNFLHEIFLTQFDQKWRRPFQTQATEYTYCVWYFVSYKCFFRRPNNTNARNADVRPRRVNGVDGVWEQ